jgi:hypothetical protein
VSSITDRPHLRGEGHLAQRGEQAAVGTVVVGEDQVILGAQLLDQVEEGLELPASTSGACSPTEL